MIVYIYTGYKLFLSERESITSRLETSHRVCFKGFLFLKWSSFAAKDFWHQVPEEER
jgi:hypothetical protein